MTTTERKLVELRMDRMGSISSSFIRIRKLAGKRPFDISNPRKRCSRPMAKLSLNFS